MTVLTGLSLGTLLLFNVWALIAEPIEGKRFNEPT